MHTGRVGAILVICLWSVHSAEGLKSLVDLLGGGGLDLLGQDSLFQRVVEVLSLSVSSALLAIHFT